MNYSQALKLKIIRLMKKILLGNLMSIMTVVIVNISQVNPLLKSAVKWVFLLMLPLLLTLKCDSQQLTENFNETTTSVLTGGSGMPTGYATGSYVLASGIWKFKYVQNTTNSLYYHSSPNACQIGSTSGSNIISPNIASGGIGTISFWASSSTGAGSPLQVGVSTDGGINFIQIGSSYALTTTLTFYNCIVNNLSSNLMIRFYKTSTVVYLDDISVTAAPAINYYWNGSNSTALNGTWNNTATAWSSPLSQPLLNTIWPATGSYTANFNSATLATTIVIPNAIATIPININIGNNNYTFTTLGGTTGNIGSPINLNTNSLTLSPISTANLSLSGIISGSGGLNLKGGGVGSSIGGNIILSAANTYSGTTTIGALNNNSQLQLDPFSSIVNSPITVANNSQLYLNGNSATTYNQGANSLSLNGFGNSINIGAIRTSNNNAYIWNGVLNIASNTSINVGSFGTLTLPAIINLSTNKITKEGAGTLILNNTGNNGTGQILINSGTIKTSAANVLFANGSLSMVAGSILDFSGNNQEIGSLIGTGTITSTTTGTPSLTIGSDNTTTSFSGIIQNGSATSVNLTKTGTGILTLSGINTFSGNTVINVGNLNLNGSLPIGNNVTIATAGTLTGNGTINGTTTIAGIVSPNTIGTMGNLAIGNTTLYAGGTYYLDINTIPINGTAGVNWDNLVTTGVINNATSISPFSISINGTIGGFKNTTAYTWSIGSYIGTTPSNANINIITSGLMNDFSGGSFSVAFENGSINLLFTPLIPCITPVIQPTALVFNSPSATSIPVSFTPASILSSGYLVIRTTYNTAPSSPIDGVIYAFHSSSLGGFVELDSNSISFTSSGLIAGSNYWYWVFTYNNSSCSGGPVYNTVAPLTGMGTTAAPTISINQNILSSFGYALGYGPSVSQFVNLIANNLSTNTGNIVIHGTTNYLVSIDNNTFSSSVSLPFNANNLTTTPIYIQLKAGLIQNNYYGETITISGGGAKTVFVLCNGTVTTTPLVLAGWDMIGQYLYGIDSMMPTTIASNLAVVGLSRGIGVGIGGSSVYSAWGGNGFMVPLPSIGIANNVFFTFSLQSNSGYSLSLAAINPFFYRRSGTGPTLGLLQYQLNNDAFVSFDTLSFPSSLSSGALISPINLNRIPALQSVSSNIKVTFRLIPYNASGVIGTFYINDGITGNDLSVIGTVTALRPVISSSLTAFSVYGTSANYQILASNTLSYSALNLPIGMTIDSLTGIINISALVLAGNYPVIISATNQGGTTIDTLIYYVTKAALSISASNQIKIYGSSLFQDSLKFSTIGLLNCDSIKGLFWVSDGIINSSIPAIYSLTPSSAIGIGISNYTITYLAGQLSVNKGKHGVWVGVSNSNFNDSTNWEDYQNTNVSDDIVIHPVVSNYPLINENITINNLTMDTLTLLIINKNADLKITGLIKNNGGQLIVNGSVEYNGNLPQSIAANTFKENTIQDLIINNKLGVSILGQLNIFGKLNPISGILNTGGFLTMKSDSNSTARISSGTGKYIIGRVTIERYITPKCIRKYSFIGSSVTDVSFRNSWQQQIYITGNGLGGLTCGNTFGNGDSTDKYNSNGFDKTQNNTPSLFTYNAFPINGSRWVSIYNTDSSALLAGIGYKVNIRGNRNLGSSCENQLNQLFPNNPNAVTLSATGILNLGDISVQLNDTSLQKYTLVANPYPSQISFAAFQSTNSLITNKFWSYSPFGNGNYSTCCQGVYVNQAKGYNSLSGDLLTSGQAFFVEANGNGNVVFNESIKVDNPIPNTQYFGITSDKILRISLLSDTVINTVSETLLDEIILRFNKFGTKEYNINWDAISFNCGNQVLTSIKDSKSLSIATYSDSNISDTAKIAVQSNSVGSFILSFSSYIDTNAISSAILNDKFLKTTYNISSDNQYPFNITNDTLSKGNNRFEVIVNQNPLAVRFISFSAYNNLSGVAINWKAVSNLKGTIYDVERSVDGVHFISFFKIASSSSAAMSYSIEDSLPIANKTYYRIKATEYDGSYVFSQTKILITALKCNNSVFSIYPNPVHNLLNICMENGFPTDYVIEISSLEGKNMVSENISIWNKKLVINCNALPNRVYILRISDKNGLLYRCKFVKV